MVHVVNAFVHERRHEQWHPDEHVPGQLEAAQRPRLDMRDLVDEQTGAVEREDRHHAGNNRQWQDMRRDRQRERAITDSCRSDHVRPIYGHVRIVELARKVCRSAQHRLVVRVTTTLSVVPAAAEIGICLPHRGGVLGERSDGHKLLSDQRNGWR